jgi:hypothetical protein
MAVEPPPTPYDLLLLARDWLGPGVGGAALLFVWRIAGRWTEVRKDHDALKDDHDETKKKVSELETKMNLTREALSGLATKDDLVALGDRMLSQITSSFGHMVALLTGKKDKPEP